ncbi:hypothetical protein EV361DRAFT_501977 [Lentinula raphanica]|nr:hypothetical protein C8R42DRAFT_403214 [Lentinula raphanica]KAJ3772955.1 hypothetical protein FB446DRAFT_22749 [Lentinula raphanica]KAJ3975399.1 hypothetical protein EV361DRAFT_501977 [Lentinula raphanica]
MSNPVLPKFFVYAPDKTEEGTFAKRMSVRNEHLARMKTILGEGTIRIGGVLLSPESLTAPPEGQKMVGSTFICQAESLEDVRKMVEGDIYYKEGVWDTEKIVVLPLMAATPIP